MFRTNLFQADQLIANVDIDQWPNQLDLIVTLAFVGLIFVLPALGYFFMVADYRAYLRSLRRGLVRVVNYLPHFPQWASKYTPRCMSVFGLKMPCTLDELKQAYREQIKELHPDRGGDKENFLLLQGYFEEAMKYIREQQPDYKPDAGPDAVNDVR